MDRAHRARIEALLEELDRWASRPGTVELFDALRAYVELGGGRPASARVADVLARHPNHPAAARVRALVDLPAPTLEDVLRRHGLPDLGGADPVAEVDRRLGEAARKERILRERVAALEAERDRALGLADRVAAAAALVAVFGLVGWLVALGVLPVDWVEPPAPDPPSHPGAIP